MLHFVFLEGPRKEPFELELVADNSTFTKVDMGELGGVRDTTAEFRGDSLISYLHNGKRVIDILAVRTVNPKSKNLIYIHGFCLGSYFPHCHAFKYFQ
jgi:hypothetical protein